MKNNNLSKFLTVASFLGGVLAVNAQNVFPAPGPGYAGIGITAPRVELHIVGNTPHELEELPAKLNKGFNAVKGEVIISNTTAGDTKKDGLKISQIGSVSRLENQEKGVMSLNTGGARVILDANTNRVGVGISSFFGNDKGAFNVTTSSDNGMYLRCIKKETIGLTIKMREEKDVAIKVLGQSNKSNFSVLKNGQVYARRYVTTLNNIPDYVFDEEYTLLSIEELQEYIRINHHLPNIPSAEEYTEEGVDLGELNRLLLEKVEELTLYVIQLNNEIKVLKENK